MHQKDIKEPFDRWYVIRVEEFIKHCGGRRQCDQKPDDIEAFFSVIDGKNHLKPWQFVQMVDAIQILFSDLVKTSWAVTFDWAGWKASAKTLSADTPP